MLPPGRFAEAAFLIDRDETPNLLEVHRIHARLRDEAAIFAMPPSATSGAARARFIIRACRGLADRWSAPVTTTSEPAIWAYNLSVFEVNSLNPGVLKARAT